MTSLTRWVLAHKRTVVVFWIVLTIAGIAAAGPASDALEPEFSVPDKEGWETNVAIAERYRGTGGDSSPLLPVVTLPKGQTVDSPGVEADLARLDARLEGGAARRADRVLRVDRRRRRSSPTTGAPPSRSSTPRPTRTRPSARTRRPSTPRSARSGAPPWRASRCT